ncbi:MAG: hypothetical protein AB8G05_22830 [Oligoflexales bacterium]
MLIKIGIVSALFLSSLNSFASDDLEEEQPAEVTTQSIVVHWSSLARGDINPLSQAAAKWQENANVRKTQIDDTKKWISQLEQDTQTTDNNLDELANKEQQIRNKLAGISEKLQKIAEEKQAQAKEVRKKKNELYSQKYLLAKMQTKQEQEQVKLQEATEILDESSKLREDLCSLEEKHGLTEDGIRSLRKKKKIHCKRSSMIEKSLKDLSWILESLADSEEQEELDTAEIIRDMHDSLSNISEEENLRASNSSENLEELNNKLEKLVDEIDAARDSILEQERAAQNVMDDRSFIRKLLVPGVVALAGTGAGAYYYYGYFQ